MEPASLRTLWRVWPRTLRARLFIVLLSGLALAHILSLTALLSERYLAARSTTIRNLEEDIATSAAISDRVSAEERTKRSGELARCSHRFNLGKRASGGTALPEKEAELASMDQSALGDEYRIRASALNDGAELFQAHLGLGDGAPLTLDIKPEGLIHLAYWLPFVLIGQLLSLIGCSWLAVRLATRPLAQLADAANGLDPEQDTPRLSEAGPSEVMLAAAAFNAMRDRVAHYLDERVQILAAISHDLQTPITRMKLRAEMGNVCCDREKLINDLDEVERLVKEGLAYARSAHSRAEPPTRIDLVSFVESLAYDYTDTGKLVTIKKLEGGVISTRPLALRRIVMNLLDNALKFGGSAEVAVFRRLGGELHIKVSDRGPGIPEGHLEKVLQPFFRLEQSCNRETGGTGLGLAIAQQLTTVVGGKLTLRNRLGGGLEAELTLSAEATVEKVAEASTTSEATTNQQWGG